MVKDKIFLNFGLALTILALLIGLWFVTNENTAIKEQISQECWFEFYDQDGVGIGVKVTNITSPIGRPHCETVHNLCNNHSSSFDCRWYNDTNICDCTIPKNNFSEGFAD